MFCYIYKEHKNGSFAHLKPEFGDTWFQILVKGEGRKDFGVGGK